MPSHTSEYVTLVEVLELIRPFEEFVAVAKAAAQRLEAEGIKELVMVQFYAKPGSTEAWVRPFIAVSKSFEQHVAGFVR